MTNDDVVIVLRYARHEAKIHPYFWRQRSKILKECFPSFLKKKIQYYSIINNMCTTPVHNTYKVFLKFEKNKKNEISSEPSDLRLVLVHTKSFSQCLKIQKNLDVMLKNTKNKVSRFRSCVQNYFLFAEFRVLF